MNLKRATFFWGALFLSIVGFILHIHQLFVFAATLAMLPLVASVLGRGKLKGLVLRRRVQPPITAGERARVEVDVRNTARVRKIFFVVSDRPQQLEPEGIDLPVAILGPGEQATLTYELQPPRRGAYPIGPAVLWTPDVIGLRNYRLEVPGVDELIVYPRPATLPYLWPKADSGRHPIKPRRRIRGQGDDLYGIRDYQPGDDPRRISWKTTARRGKLAVVEYERPESLEGMIVLDLAHMWHAGNDDRHTLEYAVTIAATLVSQAYERGSTVGLIAQAEKDFSCQALSQDEQQLRLFEALARVQPTSAMKLPYLIAAHERLLTPRCSVAVLSPSPDGGPVAAHLRGLGHPVAWFVLDSGTFGGRNVNYANLENALLGAHCKVHHVYGDRPLLANWRRGGTYATA